MPCFIPPVRAAIPPLLAPDAPTYPEEAEAEESNVVVPLLLPCVSAPPETLTSKPVTGAAVEKSQTSVVTPDVAGLTVKVAGLLVTEPAALVTTTS